MAEMNGAHLFAGALALYGLRPQAARDIDSAFLPFDIVTANAHERPIGLEGGVLVIGGYRFDGSLVTLDVANGSIRRIDRGNGARLNSWACLADFISAELQRLDALHDANATLLAPREMLVPSVI
jgi:hypothetical protein